MPWEILWERLVIYQRGISSGTRSIDWVLWNSPTRLDYKLAYSLSRLVGSPHSKLDSLEHHSF